MDYEKYRNILRLANQNLEDCKRNGFAQTLKIYTTGAISPTGVPIGNCDMLEWAILYALDQIKNDTAAYNPLVGFIMSDLALPKEEFEALRTFIEESGWRASHVRYFDAIFGIK